MKKLIFVTFCLLFLVLVLTACHQNTEMPEFVCPEELTEDTVEITFWAKNDSNNRQVEIYNQAIKDFEALYPNVKITLKRYTDYGLIYNDVITNISTGTTPNVCITYPDHIATYMSGDNIVVPLDGLMANEKYGVNGTELRFDGADTIATKFLNEGKLYGEQYALPFLRSTEACYINKTYVEALGYDVPDVLTWDYIFEVSETAMKKADDGTYLVNGQTTLIPFIYKSTDNMMIQMVEQKELGYSTEDGDVLLFNDGVREIMKTVSYHAKSRAFSTFKISSYPGNFFNAGQCIFAIDSTAGATWIGPNAPLMDIDKSEAVDFEAVVRPIPQYDTNNPKMISQGPSICIFNKANPDEVLASWLFAQFLLTDGVQIPFATTEGYIPVTEHAQNSAEYLDYLTRAGEDNDLYYDIKIKASKMLLDNIDNTFITPVFSGSASLRNAAGQLIEEACKAARRNQTVDDAFVDATYGKIISLYKLGKKDLGKLPSGSVILIVTLSAIWLALSGEILYSLHKKRKNRKKT